MTILAIGLWLGSALTFARLRHWGFFGVTVLLPPLTVFTLPFAVAFGAAHWKRRRRARELRERREERSNAKARSVEDELDELRRRVAELEGSAGARS